MNPVITITTDENGDIVVSGRELRYFLGVKTEYKDWFPRMVAYGFVEGVDYTVITEEVDAQKRARTYGQINHLLKLDMAKAISMIQRTEKGRQMRQYFIEIEKKYRQQVSTPQVPAVSMEQMRADHLLRCLRDYASVLNETTNNALQEHIVALLTGKHTGSQTPVPAEEVEPRKPALYTAKEIGEIVGVAPTKVAAIANMHGIRKNPMYGTYNPDNPFNVVRYNAEGKAKLLKVLQEK